MFKFPKSKMGKDALKLGAVIGLVAGVAAGALLPDEYNPVEIVKEMVKPKEPVS